MSQKNRYPIVFITPEARQKLDLYIQCAHGEISGLGEVIRLGNDFLIKDIYLFEQKCTSASTNLDPGDVSKFLSNYIQSGKDPSDLRLWWHSHDNMSTFWSGTDEATAERLGDEWMLCIVGNKNLDYLVRLDLYKPIRITLDGLKFMVHWCPNTNLQSEIEAEIKAKVKTPPPIKLPTFPKRNVKTSLSTERGCAGVYPNQYYQDQFLDIDWQGDFGIRDGSK